MVGGIDVPFDTNRGSGQNRQAGSFVIVPGRGQDCPKAHPGEWPKVTRPEVLLPHHGDGEVPERPCPYIHLYASVIPLVLHDQTHEADATEAYADSSPLGPGALGNIGTGNSRGG